jgi:hypothetical protein
VAHIFEKKRPRDFESLHLPLSDVLLLLKARNYWSGGLTWAGE